jgi:hypothetical protein
VLQASHYSTIWKETQGCLTQIRVRRADGLAPGSGAGLWHLFLRAIVKKENVQHITELRRRKIRACFFFGTFHQRYFRLRQFIKRANRIAKRINKKGLEMANEVERK